MSNSTLSASARRVQQALESLGLSLKVVELADSTRTALQAAQAVGCEVGQIAKSLVFATSPTNRTILIITSGKNRVNEKYVGHLLGEKLSMADAETVRRVTGFAIGGVPPVGHDTRLDTYIDQDLLDYEVIWAAAGTPFAVFELTPTNLVRITGGTVIEVHPRQ
jgi:Cys-tRNA(Pro) deacylase